MDNKTYYLNHVWERVPDDVKRRTLDIYPNASLTPRDGFVPLVDLPVCMVVGLTGTGKTTSLAQLAKLRERGAAAYADDIPNRRDLADLVRIPTAQVVLGEPVAPVTDREARFRYVGAFAEAFEPNGNAAVYTWLHYRGAANVPLVSEGVRGEPEINYVLGNCPRWWIVELWVSPVERLRRLSGRKDSLDVIDNPDAADLEFLPEDVRDEARRLIAAGEVSAKAVSTARAETNNYSLLPFDATNSTPRYRCLTIDAMQPDAVAREIADILKGMT